MLMVKAGAPVDELIEECLPFLEKGDILIDGGNSHYPDTERRDKELESQRDFIYRHRHLGRRRGGPSWPFDHAWRQSRCLAAHQSRFFRRLPLKQKTRRPAATGWEKGGLATMSKWSTTGSNMATCSSSAKPTSFARFMRLYI